MTREIPKKKIVMYATSENGEGRVMKIGEFEDIEDIQIIVGMFDKDTIINLEYRTDDETSD